MAAEADATGEIECAWCGNGFTPRARARPDTQFCSKTCRSRARYASLRRCHELEAIVRDLVDPDDCWYDHHGYCQAHFWLTEGVCPHKRAKEFLDQHDDKGTE